MKVLLISVVTENMNMVVLPLGTAYVAAAAEDAGHEIRQISINSEEQNFRGILKREIKDFNPGVIGLSMRNVDDQSMTDTKFLVKPVRELVRACRKLTDAKIVLGGAGYSIFPKSALTYTQADMGIKGEGEIAFTRMLDALEKGNDMIDIPGLCIRTSGRPIPATYPKTLESYTMPLPNIHLDVPENESGQPVWIPIQTRRGCPMDCSYCSTSTIEGRTLRKHSPEKVVNNIKQYVNKGITHFHFVDNTFNLPSSYAEELCDRIVSEKLKIKGRCIVYPAKIKERLVKKMAKAGIREISLGFESGCDAILKNFNKRFTSREVSRISKMFKKEKIFQMGFLLLGGPGETRETAMESLRFADSLELEAMKISVGIRIYPFTDLAKTAVAEGKISPRDNLLDPKFYIGDGLEDWLKETVVAWAKDRQNWMV